MPEAISSFYCLTCNYPLRDLSEPRCPECGRSFNPYDVTTMNVGRPLPPAARRLLDPPGRWFHRFVWANAALLLIAVSGPAPYVLLVLPSLLVWLLLGGWWMFRALAYVLMSYRFAQPLFWTQLRNWTPWLLAPIVVVVTAGLIRTRVPLRAAFLLSRPALEAAVSNPQTKPGWIGLFPVHSILRESDDTHFIVWGSGFLDAGCLRHVSNNMNVDQDGDGHRLRFYLRSNWAVCSRDF